MQKIQAFKIEIRTDSVGSYSHHRVDEYTLFLRYNNDITDFVKFATKSIGKKDFMLTLYKMDEAYNVYDMIRFSKRFDMLETRTIDNPTNSFYDLESEQSITEIKQWKSKMQKRLEKEIMNVITSQLELSEAI